MFWAEKYKSASFTGKWEKNKLLGFPLVFIKRGRCGIMPWDQAVNLRVWAPQDNL